MDRGNGGAPGASDVPGDSFDNEMDNAESYGSAERFVPNDYYEPYQSYGEDREPVDDKQHEPLRRGLAQFAFMREDDDREVRLFFRDVPAHEIARAFRGSGALLISITADRTLPSASISARSQDGWTNVEIAPDATHAPKRRKKRTHKATAAIPDDIEGATTPAHPTRHIGELTMRYFFSLDDLVYTVNIASPTGIVESVASIFPVAAQSEHELNTRLAVVFREVRS